MEEEAVAVLAVVADVLLEDADALVVELAAAVPLVVGHHGDWVTLVIDMGWFSFRGSCAPPPP
jgi:hypothetical protein